MVPFFFLFRKAGLFPLSLPPPSRRTPLILNFLPSQSRPVRFALGVDSLTTPRSSKSSVSFYDKARLSRTFPALLTTLPLPSRRFLFRRCDFLPLLPSPQALRTMVPFSEMLLFFFGTDELACSSDGLCPAGFPLTRSFFSPGLSTFRSSPPRFVIAFERSTRYPPPDPRTSC